MEAHGLRPEQVNQVRGYADRELRHPDNPMHASNRRISVIVQYLPPPPGEEAKEEGKPEEGKKGAEKKGEPKKEEPKKAETPKDSPFKAGKK
jgi:chemotaxis protein MotB